MSRGDLSGIGLFHPGQQPQQRGLARAVEPEHDDPAAPVDGQVDVGEHLERAVGLRQPFARSAGSCRTAPGSGNRSLATRSPAARRPGRRAAGRRGAACSARPWPWSPWRASWPPAAAARRPAARRWPAPAAAPLVGLALGQVGLPADVVDVQHGAVGVQVEDLVDDLLDEVDVVADDEQPAAVVLEVVAQPGDRVGVQVVGRLVEQQRLRVAEQDPGQLDPPALPAGQRAQRLVQHPVGQPEAGGQARRLATPPRSRRARRAGR